MIRPAALVHSAFLVGALFAGTGSTLVAAVQPAAATPTFSSAAVISACVAKLDGFTRIVASRNDCILQFETYVSWLQAGIPGPAGASGQAGAIGPQGPAGPNGATGPAGPQGATGPSGPAGAPGAPATSGTPQQFVGHFTHSGAGSAGPNSNTAFTEYQPISGLGGFASYFGASAAAQPTAQNTYQQIASSCTASNFKVAIFGQAEIEQVAFVVSPTPTATPTNVTVLCSPFTANPGSCPATTASVSVPSGSYVSFEVSAVYGNHVVSGDVYTSFTCQ